MVQFLSSLDPEKLSTFGKAKKDLKNQKQEASKAKRSDFVTLFSIVLACLYQLITLIFSFVFVSLTSCRSALCLLSISFQLPIRKRENATVDTSKEKSKKRSADTDEESDEEEDEAVEAQYEAKSRSKVRRIYSLIYAYTQLHNRQ